MAQIILTEEECIEMFHSALCNGMEIVSQHGLELDWDEEHYHQAKSTLIQNGQTGICYEDVLIQMLKDGEELQIVDVEGGKNSDYNVTITLKDVIKRVPNTPQQHLTDMLCENDDATTADVILQTVFYNEVIFG